ncbi:hypothetical protein DH2020_006872 [Rehmannia glutinosa]|uniref:Dirigent protein n=1 Tax=Rehmannia glutinosa TaxID=99300 RepID=A0ABR0XK48_REHGL
MYYITSENAKEMCSSRKLELKLLTKMDEKFTTKDHQTTHSFSRTRKDRISGPNQTVYKVAESSITSTSRSLFGQVNVIDDLFTVGPKPTSKILGRAQGIIGFADLNEIGLHMSITFSFSSGKYNGSTLSMLGRNGFSQESRMMPIVGGTGAFELARGIVTSTTYSFDPTTNHAVLEYNIVVHHY